MLKAPGTDATNLNFYILRCLIDELVATGNLDRDRLNVRLAEVAQALSKEPEKAGKDTATFIRDKFIPDLCAKAP